MINLLVFVVLMVFFYFVGKSLSKIETGHYILMICQTLLGALIFSWILVFIFSIFFTIQDYWDRGNICRNLAQQEKDSCRELVSLFSFVSDEIVLLPFFVIIISPLAILPTILIVSTIRKKYEESGEVDLEDVKLLSNSPSSE
jgi:hypothetical protein